MAVQTQHGELRLELAEEHWSFMDRYRLDDRSWPYACHRQRRDDDGGSVHLTELPNAAAAEVFVFEDPYFKAGIFDEVLIRRWSNTLERTMWDFGGRGGRRFLIVGHGAVDATARRSKLRKKLCAPSLVTGGFVETD